MPKDTIDVTEAFIGVLLEAPNMEVRVSRYTFTGLAKHEWELESEFDFQTNQHVFRLKRAPIQVETTARVVKSLPSGM